jgi:hypothetical protein
MLMLQGAIQLNPIPINMLLPLHIEALYLKQSKTDNTAEYVTYLVTTLRITLCVSRFNLANNIMIT